MGVHTGDSITVAPAQTLTDKEFQIMRNAAIAVLREIGVETGGSNVQFGIDPQTGRMVIIEMNPRVSRSSALASKATGFPIAKIAAKLAVGFTLDELANDITGGKTPASFEPSIDYVVTKIPRFNFEKFAGANDRLTTQMKSVGEVMAIGRNQQESLQKALRGLEVGATGLNPILDMDDPEAKTKLIYELRNPGAERIWYIGDAFRMGMTVDEIFELTNIDPWYLVQLQDIIQLEQQIERMGLAAIDSAFMRSLKRKGFADARIAELTGAAESEVRKKRYSFDILPVYKRVDTCAAEFSTSTAYMYSTYDEECEANPSDKRKIMVIGGGPNRIGQGIEFDYCCVHAALAMREDGYETIMVNCNPETVSTDYDTSDRLYFEPVTLEDVLEIVRIEQPEGVIVQYGGQTPLKLARALKENGVNIIGTSPDAIDRAEDRERFQQMVDKLGLKQPANATVSNMEEALEKAKIIGFPLVVRPSYVLGGRAMEIVYDLNDLQRYLNEAVSVSNDSPVLLDRFLDDAIEVDVDAICDGKDVLIGGIMEHIEQAGVHSGDSACSLPPYSLSPEIQDVMRQQVKDMALELGVVGLMNTQFAIKDNEVYLIEVNPRAARTVPFVSKATGLALAKIAARTMVNKSLKEQGITKEIIPPFYSVKEVVLPFAKFQGVDPLLGPEMRSTGEVMGIGANFEEAYAKANLGASAPLPTQGKVLLSVRNNDKRRVIELAQIMLAKGFKLEATSGTADVLLKAGLACTKVNKLLEGRPNIVDAIKNDEYTYLVNTTEGRQAITDSVYIRREALLGKVAYTTTLNGAFATMQSTAADAIKNVNSIQELHKQIQA
jgi:carbamoyl-phosphate synthase large subunit